MAKGFKKEEKQKSKGYKTIFEKVKDKTDGEEQTWQWYRRTVRSMALEYKQRPEKQSEMNEEIQQMMKKIVMKID